MVFTRKQVLITIADKVIWAILLVVLGDFYQVILCGSMQALGKLKLATIANIITYYVIACPLAYYLAFIYGSHDEFVHPKMPNLA